MQVKTSSIFGKPQMKIIKPCMSLFGNIQNTAPIFKKFLCTYLDNSSEIILLNYYTVTCETIVIKGLELKIKDKKHSRYSIYK